MGILSAIGVLPNQNESVIDRLAPKQPNPRHRVMPAKKDPERDYPVIIPNWNTGRQEVLWPSGEIEDYDAFKNRYSTGGGANAPDTVQQVDRGSYDQFRDVLSNYAPRTTIDLFGQGEGSGILGFIGAKAPFRAFDAGKQMQQGQYGKAAGNMGMAALEGLGLAELKGISPFLKKLGR
jgi:hypothetical protein